MTVPANQFDKFKVVIHGRIEGQLTNNVWYFAAASSIDDVDERLIQALWECFVETLLPVASSAWRVEKITYMRVSPTVGPEFTFIPVGAAQGGGSSESLPSFNSALISLRTLEGGRSKRGRTYLPGIPEDATIGSSLDPESAFWLALIQFCLCMAGKFLPQDPQPANSFIWTVYSRKLGGATLPYQAVGFTPVSDINAQSLIGSTRSRKVGRGA